MRYYLTLYLDGKNYIYHKNHTKNQSRHHVTPKGQGRYQNICRAQYLKVRQTVDSSIEIHILRNLWSCGR